MNALIREGVHEKGGIEVLSVEGSKTRDAIYLVRQLCCGRTEHLKHLAVKRRARGETGKICRRCFATANTQALIANGGSREPVALPEKELVILRQMVEDGCRLVDLEDRLKMPAETIRRHVHRLGLGAVMKANWDLRQKEMPGTDVNQIVGNAAWVQDRKRLRDRTPRPVILWLGAMLRVR